MKIHDAQPFLCSLFLSFLALWFSGTGMFGESVSLAEEGTSEELLPVWDAEKVSILANQGTQPIQFAIEQTRDGDRINYTLQPGESMVVANPQQAAAVFEHGEELVRLRLLQDEIYLFVKPHGVQELVGIGPDYGIEIPQSRIQGRDGKQEMLQPLVIPVKIYTDANIPLAEPLWRKRVSQRIADASKILEKTCLVKLEIQSFETWQSDPQCKNLPEVLKDFESKVPETPGVLSIGFTAHKNVPGAGMELGVARQPFCGKILLREEAPQITEVERLETLLHELGHFLGAVHTSDENSVMRTILHERHARAVNFVIGFDPLNAMAMNLWIRQYRRADGKQLRTVNPDICTELLTLYRLVQQFADQQEAQGEKVLENPNVERFILMLERLQELQGTVVSKPETQAEPEKNTASETKPKQETQSEPKVQSELESPTNTETQAKQETQAESQITVELKQPNEVQILEKMMQKLTSKPWITEQTEDFELPVKTTRYIMTRTLLSLAKNEPLKGFQTEGKMDSDILGEKIVRYAAWAALEVGGTGTPDSPEGRAARSAFLLACEIFLEPTGAVGKIPVYGRRFRVIETEELKKLRQNLVESDVSIFGRADHSQHFWVSAALVVQIVPELVENIGVEKEIRDDQEGGTGFDVTDLNADVAGAWFGFRVLKGKISLERIGREFDYSDVLPSQIRIPKRLKHPKTPEEMHELLLKLRNGTDAVQEKFE